ncbi:MAG TPA: cyclodeaminase/cyclohydrolase family protein [Firmicutes bacterium]|nr:cyclodeaminase/cyclohydrolase family protein [Bacillota bacterium]
MLAELKLGDFLEQLASASPVPGGGAASALAGAAAAALVSMVANLTLGRKKFETHKVVMEEVLARSETLRRELLKLADRDMAAFQAVMAAYRMPKDTAAERAQRDERIQACLKEAATVPAEVIRLSAEVFELSEKARRHGNPNAASDAGTAAALAVAAIHGAALNVFTNLESINDKEFVQNMRNCLAHSETVRRLISR